MRSPSAEGGTRGEMWAPHGSDWRRRAFSAGLTVGKDRRTWPPPRGSEFSEFTVLSSRRQEHHFKNREQGGSLIKLNSKMKAIMTHIHLGN